MNSFPKVRRVRAWSPRGLHRIAYREWGDRDNPRVAMCVHGLTRNAGDFEVLAAALASRYRVICPDVVGRGDSDWLPEPELYTYQQYLADSTVLLAALGVEAVDWIGTSMGGLIGMMLAAQDDSPIRRLVLNDIGPFVPASALERLAAYVGIDVQWDSLADAEQYLRRTYASFGALSDPQWHEFTLRSVAATDGGYVARYDPQIGVALRNNLGGDVELWALWEQVRCPTLVLRGEQSDLLLRETARQMQVSGPRATVVEIAGCGHAPALLDVGQVALIADWLDADGV